MLSFLCSKLNLYFKKQNIGLTMIHYLVIMWYLNVMWYLSSNVNLNVSQKLQRHIKLFISASFTIFSKLLWCINCFYFVSIMHIDWKYYALPVTALMIMQFLLNTHLHNLMLKSNIQWSTNNNVSTHSNNYTNPFSYQVNKILM